MLADARASARAKPRRRRAGTGAHGRATPRRVRQGVRAHPQRAGAGAGAHFETVNARRASATHSCRRVFSSRAACSSSAVDCSVLPGTRRRCA